MNANEKSAHLTRLKLDVAAFSAEAGVPPASREHLSACAQCRESVAQLRTEREAFLKSRPAPLFVAHVEQKLDAPKASIWRPWFTWVAVGAAASLMVFVVQPEKQTDPFDIRDKGTTNPTFEVFASRGGLPAVLLPDNAELSPGDVIRFGVNVPKDCFVFVANLDAKGSFSRYFPELGTRSVALRAGKHMLPGSIALDDFEGDELVALIVSDVSLSETDISVAFDSAFRAAQSLAALKALEIPGKVYFHRHRKVR